MMPVLESMIHATNQSSQGYTIALEHIRSNVALMREVRSNPRKFSLYSIQRLIKAPQNAEGYILTRDITKKALDTLVEEGMIVSYKIHPVMENGPEWASVTIPKKPRKRGHNAGSEEPQ